MKIIKKINIMQQIAREYRSKKIKVGFVPTMGYLHQGHISLIKAARKENNIVIISIFVNPAQFSPGEDFDKYPRDLKRDVSIAEKEGVDIIFHPCPEAMYPENFSTYVVEESLTRVFCGVSRPGHFRGVTTVVAKLFNILIPNVAYFGQKDMQQAIIINRMIRDLNIPVKIRILSIVRDKDGLALSSRNKYLNFEERKEALILYHCICLAERKVKQGETRPHILKKMIERKINSKKLVKIDYIDIVDLENFRPVKKIDKNSLLALAVWIGGTRLIDNTILSPN